MLPVQYLIFLFMEPHTDDVTVTGICVQFFLVLVFELWAFDIWFEAYWQNT